MKLKTLPVLHLVLMLFSILVERDCDAQYYLVPNSNFQFGNNSPNCNSGTWSDFDANILYWECAMEEAGCYDFPWLYPHCPTSDWLDKAYCTGPLAYGTYPQNSPSNRFVGLLKDNNWNEGIRTTIATSLVPFKFYTVRVKLSMASNNLASGGTVNIHFSSLSQHWNGSSATRLLNVANFAIPPNKPHEWFTFTKTFFYNGIATDLNNIILIRNNNDPNGTYIYVDDVELYETTSLSCRIGLRIENTEYSYREIKPNGETLPYEVSSSIFSGYNASNPYITDGNVIAKNGSQIAYKAGEDITLLPGFTVEPGADFRAYIADCGKECKYPESFISENNNITICSNGVHCWDLGRPAKYGETYLWTSEPSWGVNYLSSTNISNPKLCIDTYTLPADFGNVRFFLNVSNACNDNCDCSSLTVSYDLQGANRNAPVIYASNTTPTNATGLFECHLDLSGTTGKFIVEVYYTNWDNYYDPIWTPSPNGPYTYYDGIDYNRGNNFTFQFNVHENGFNHPPFRFKFHFIAKNACDTEQGDAWSDIYEWVDD
jgi:hypothetical protein